MSSPDKLKRKLNLFDSTMIVSGAIIGCGIFVNSAESARYLESSYQLLLLWLLGGVIIFIDALNLSELGAMFPKCGGQYVYLEKAFGKRTGFLYGWTVFSTTQTASISAVAVICAVFTGKFVPMSQTAVNMLAVAIIWILTIINYLGIKPGSIFQNIVTILKLSSLAAVIIVGVFFYNPGTSALGELFPSGLSGGTLSLMGLALIPIIFSYGGAKNLNYVAGEVQRPARTIPLAIISGVLIVIVCYIFMNYVYVKAMPIGEIASTPKLAADVMEIIGGSLGAAFISMAIIISTLGISHVMILTGSRVLYAMAEEKVFIPVASKIHPRYETPHAALIIQAAAASIFVFTNSYGELLQYVVFADAIFISLIAAAVIVLRRKMPSAERPYRVWGYPVTPLIVAVIFGAIALNVLAASPVQSGIGVLLILIGLPFYEYYTRKQNKNKKEQ